MSALIGGNTGNTVVAITPKDLLSKTLIGEEEREETEEYIRANSTSHMTASSHAHSYTISRHYTTHTCIIV